MVNLNVNKWRNTQNVIESFGNIEEKAEHSFFSYSIFTRQFLKIYWTKHYLGSPIWLTYDTYILKTLENHSLSITENHRSKNNSNLFDVTIGNHDGAETCELVGLFILNHLGKKFAKKNICLYRDDGLAIIKNRSAGLADKTRKELHKFSINLA